MHRATPLNTSFRAYSSGGARTLIDKADDGQLMQEMGGNMMKGETRSEVGSPQNYGFTSVVADATKGENGEITGSAEGFMSFMGGNRSFPVCAIMDDRRHRLHSLEKGDSAMYRGKDDRQQFHMTGGGNFMSCRDDRVQRIALVPKPQDDQQQQKPSPQQQADGGGSGGGQKQQQQQQATGQKAALDDNKKSQVYMEQTGSVQTQRHGPAHSAQRPSDSSTYMTDRKKSTQATDEHVHLRINDMRIFVDRMGCWSEIPMLVKKDSYCKE